MADEPGPPAAAAPPAKAPFALREGERHVARSAGAVIHRFGVTTGRLWLTSERLVFAPVIPLAFWVLLPLGLLLYAINRPHRRELPLEQIGARERTAFGRNRNVLVIATRDLSRDLRVIVDDFDAFHDALTAELARLARASQ